MFASHCLCICSLCEVDSVIMFIMNDEIKKIKYFVHRGLFPTVLLRVLPLLTAASIFLAGFLACVRQCHTDFFSPCDRSSSKQLFYM